MTTITNLLLNSKQIVHQLLWQSEKPCKGLTVIVYFYFPLSLHHYCCIICASLTKKSDVAKNDVRIVDFG